MEDGADEALGVGTEDAAAFEDGAPFPALLAPPALGPARKAEGVALRLGLAPFSEPAGRHNGWFAASR